MWEIRSFCHPPGRFVKEKVHENGLNPGIQARFVILSTIEGMLVGGHTD